MERLNEKTAGCGARPEHIRVLQFGEGNFLRAFADEMLDRLNAQGGDLGVAIVKPREKGSCQALREQDCLYTVLLRGREEQGDVKESRIIRSVRAVVEPYQDFLSYLELARIETLRFIISNTTEAGIVYTGQDQYADAPQASFPGKLTRFLHERFRLGLPGFILLPCELIDDNGPRLRETVLQTARQWGLDADFEAWIERENIFCSTLVDRIVTGFPKDEADALFAEMGYEDQLLVAAEPFGLWVIEGPEQVRRELPLDGCCPVVFTDNVKPYKLRKVRMLNGAHTTMTPVGFLAGLDTVGQCMADEDVRDFLGHALLDEIMPNVPLPREEVAQFAMDTCRRFENPFNHHALLSIALNSVSKWSARVLPTLRDYRQKNGKIPPCLCFGLAALIMFYAGIRQNADGEYEGIRDGKPYPVRDDPQVLSAFAHLSCDMPPESLAYAVLSDQEMWGEDLREILGLEDMVTDQLRDLQLIGLRAAMRRAWEGDAE